MWLRDSELAVELSFTSDAFDLPVQEPRAGVVGGEPNRDVVARYASADCIALDRVIVVVHGTASAADDAERVLKIGLDMPQSGKLRNTYSVKMERVLESMSTLARWIAKRGAYRSADGQAGE